MEIDETKIKQNKNEIEKIKRFLMKNPNAILVKNKHKLITMIMLKSFPELNQIDKEILWKISKRYSTVSRNVNKAKENLRETNRISLNAHERVLLQKLQIQTQLELGYPV